MRPLRLAFSRRKILQAKSKRTCDALVSRMPLAPADASDRTVAANRIVVVVRIRDLCLVSPTDDYTDVLCMYIVSWLSRGRYAGTEAPEESSITSTRLEDSLGSCELTLRALIL